MDNLEAYKNTVRKGFSAWTGQCDLLEKYADIIYGKYNQNIPVIKKKGPSKMYIPPKTNKKGYHNIEYNYEEDVV